MAKNPRLAVRAVIVQQGRLLLVNAWPGRASDLWCAPGGGVEAGASLPDNLARELHEELGLAVRVGAPCLVNEFHDPASGFHQVEVFFRARLIGAMPAGWGDTAGVVNRHVWATADDLRGLRVKPDALAGVAFGDGGGAVYDPLEVIQR
jgi:8-oxo-dGTP diphosphatase